jgi:protein gp37
MIERSEIGWTDYSGDIANFVLRGKQKGDCEVSTGCANCYAFTLRNRNRAQAANITTYNGAKLAALGRVELRENGQPYRRGLGARPMVFVVDMGDLFHDLVPDAFILRAIDTLAGRPDVDWQILTKRAERMARLLVPLGELPPNLWIGVTAENQKCLDKRLPLLAQVRAAVRFASCEPLLGPVTLPMGVINWLIVGGESGGDRRPFYAAWARALRDWCQAAGVAMFYKQGSAYKQGRDYLLDGQEVKQWPAVGVTPGRELAPTLPGFQAWLVSEVVSA